MLEECFTNGEELETTERRQASLQPISAEEAESLFDLPNKIWKYKPEERMSAESLTKNFWFTDCYHGRRKL